MVWLAARPRTSLFPTTVTRGEVPYGIRPRPEGHRRRALWEAARGVFDQEFAGQILSFDADAADAYAVIAAERRAAGRQISQFDAMIAGIARSSGASVATRNVKDFEDCGLVLLTPGKG